MRCPKCGYISFDHVETCLKCSKDISKFSSELEGTTYNVKPPSFLKFRKSEDQAQESRISFEAEDEYDVVDPDLDVLVEEDENNEEGIAFEGGLDLGHLDEEESFELGLDDDDEDDAGIDLGQFEDAFEEEEPEERDAGSISINLPDELADISDLSAPEQKTVEQKLAPAAALDGNFDDLSLELDIDDLDDDEFSLMSGGNGDQTEDDSLENLSLDDLGLSEPEEDVPPPPRKEHGAMDMDADLDFDLDLGGISLDKDE